MELSYIFSIKKLFSYILGNGTPKETSYDSGGNYSELEKQKKPTLKKIIVFPENSYIS